jgi:hypothetical protein
MKIIRILSLLVGVSSTVFTGTAVSQQSDSIKPPFTLEITATLEEGHSDRWDFANTADKVVRDGSRVVVGIRKANRSAHEINRMSQGGGVFGYQYEVRDSSGNLIKPRQRDQNAPILLGGPGRLIGSKDILEPGESSLKGTPLSDWFDMSKPGTYTVQVWEHVSNDPASAVVRSNTIRIQVLPTDDSPPPQQ